MKPDPRVELAVYKAFADAKLTVTHDEVARISAAATEAASDAAKEHFTAAFEAAKEQIAEDERQRFEEAEGALRAEVATQVEDLRAQLKDMRAKLSAAQGDLAKQREQSERHKATIKRLEADIGAQVRARLATQLDKTVVELDNALGSARRIGWTKCIEYAVVYRARVAIMSAVDANRAGAPR